MFDAIEPLLLDGDNEPAVDQQRGGRIVIHGIDSKNVHWPTFARVISSAPAIVAAAASIAMSAPYTTTITRRCMPAPQGSSFRSVAVRTRHLEDVGSPLD